MKKFFLLFLIFNINLIKPAQEAKYNLRRSLISKINWSKVSEIDWLNVSDEQKKHIVNYLISKYAYRSIIKYFDSEKEEVEKLRDFLISSLKNIEEDKIGLIVRLKSGDDLIALAIMVYNHISKQYKAKCGSELLKPEEYIII